jgi:hypothetical protein
MPSDIFLFPAIRLAAGAGSFLRYLDRGIKELLDTLRLSFFFKRQTANRWKASDLALAVAFGVNARRFKRQGGSFQVSDLLQDFKE